MDKFKKQAIKLGLCQEWQNNWEETGLIDKYIRGITWCMKNEFPLLSNMKKYDDALLRNGVYNQKTADIKCDRDMYVFNSSDVDFTISGYSVCRIYVGRGSNVTVNVKDNAILYVDNYDSNVIVNKHENARCVVWNK
jgi:hypothetical protein